MENKYNSTKNTVKRYIASVALAGALAYGSYSASAASLPINPETKQALSQVSKDYNDLEKEVTNSFNQAISDGRFDIKEQETIFNKLKELKTYAKKHNQNLSPGLETLERRLIYNIEGFDKGKVELEKDMEEEGYKCYVQPTGSGPEYISGIFGALLLFVGATRFYNNVK